MSTPKCEIQTKKLNTNCRFLDANLQKTDDFVACNVCRVSQQPTVSLATALIALHEGIIFTIDQNSE